MEPAVCSLHGPLEKKIDDGFASIRSEMQSGFGTVNGRLDGLFRELGEREGSDKGQWSQIKELRGRVERVPEQIAEAIGEHRRGCAIGEITEVGIKLPKRDTPTRGTRRPSLPPTGGSFRIPRVVILAGVILGVAIAAGGWALSLLLRADLQAVLPAVTTLGQ